MDIVWLGSGIAFFVISIALVSLVDSLRTEE